MSPSRRRVGTVADPDEPVCLDVLSCGVGTDHGEETERMNRDFDPYEEWLGIPPDRRPPSYYDLVGVPVDETDRRRIDDAAMERMEQVRARALGQHGDQVTRILNELSQALDCLVNPGRKKAYDEQQLRAGVDRRLESGQRPADFYELLQTPRFTPNRSYLLSAIRCAKRHLKRRARGRGPAKRHAEALLEELKNAETALSGPSAFQQYHRPILAEMYRDYVEDHSRDEKLWNLPELRQWLEQEKRVHPDRAEAVVYGMCDTRIDGWNQLLAEMYPAGRGADTLAIEPPAVELSDEAGLESDDSEVANRPRAKPPKLPPMPRSDRPGTDRHGERSADDHGEVAATLPARFPARRLIIVVALFGALLACVAAAALLAMAVESWDREPASPGADLESLGPEARRRLREARFGEATDILLGSPPNFDAALERLEATCAEFPELEGLEREYALSAWCYACQGRWPDTWRCYQQARIRLGPAQSAATTGSEQAWDWLADVRQRVFLSTVPASEQLWREMSDLERRLGGTLEPPEQLQSLFDQPDQPWLWTGRLERLVAYGGELHLLVSLVRPENGVARIEALTKAAGFAEQIRDYQSAAECGVADMVSVKGARVAQPEGTPEGGTMPAFRLDPEATLIRLESVHRVGEPASLAEVGRQLRTAFRDRRESTELARYLQAPPDPDSERTIRFHGLVVSFADVTETESETFARTLHLTAHPNGRRVAEVLIGDGTEIGVPDVGIGDWVSVEGHVVGSDPDLLTLEAAAIRPPPEARAAQAPPELAASEPSPTPEPDDAQSDEPGALPAGPAGMESLITGASDTPDGEAVVEAMLEALTGAIAESEGESSAPPQPGQPPQGHVFQVETGQGAVVQVAWSPDDEYVATAGGETAKIWDPWRGEILRTCGERVPVTDIAWHPGTGSTRQTLLALGCGDENIRIFDVGAEKSSPSGYVETGSPVGCLAWSGDGRTLGAGLESGEFVLSKLADGEAVKQRASSSFHAITSIAWHPRNARVLAVADEEGLLWIWDLQRMAPLHGRIDRQLASFRGMVSQNAKLRDLITTGSVRLVDRPVSRCHQLAWSPDGNQIAVAENGVEVWNFHHTEGLRWATGMPPSTGRGSSAASAFGSITSVAWHPLGRSLAMGISGGRVVVFEVTGGRQIRQFQAPAEVESVAWSRRGRHLAAGSRDGTLTVWEFGR